MNYPRHQPSHQPSIPLIWLHESGLVLPQVMQPQEPPPHLCCHKMGTVFLTGEGGWAYYFPENGSTVREEKDYFVSKWNKTKRKPSIQINNDTGINKPDQHWEATAEKREGHGIPQSKNLNLFQKQDAAQHPATQKSATKTHTIQWSSNIKGVQVSPAKDISEVFFVPLGLYVLSEWKAVPSDAALPPQTCWESPISSVTGTDSMAL